MFLLSVLLHFVMFFSGIMSPFLGASSFFWPLPGALCVVWQALLVSVFHSFVRVRCLESFQVVSELEVCCIFVFPFVKNSLVYDTSLLRMLLFNFYFPTCRYMSGLFLMCIARCIS